MLPVYLRLTNFLSYVNCELNFPELDYVTLIIGIDRGNTNKSNGSGKSSIFEAITWALFEKCRINGSASTTIDDVVRQGTEKAEVEFHFQLGKDLYRIIRSRDQKRHKSDIIFQIKGEKRWQSVGADKKKETNPLIVSTLGLNYDVFVNSVLLKQHEASAFATMTSGDRKDVISRILQLSHYDDYSVAAKKKGEELDLKLVESDAFLKTYENTASEKLVSEVELQKTQQDIGIHTARIEALRANLEKIRGEQAEERKKVAVKEELQDRLIKISERVAVAAQNLQDALRGAEKYRKRVEETKASLDKVRARVLQIKEGRGDPNKIKQALIESEEKTQQLTNQCTQTLVRVQSFEENITSKQEGRERVKKMEEGQCPTCFGDVTESSKEHAIKGIEEELEVYKKEYGKYKEQLNALQRARAVAEKEKEEAERQRDAFNKLQEEGRSLMDRWTDGKKNLQEHEENLRDAEGTKASYSQQLMTIQDEKVECLDKIQKLNIDDSRFRQLGEEAAQKNGEINIELGVISQLQKKEGSLRERVESYVKILQQIEVIKKDRAAVDRERRIYRELTHAFSKTGIQALIFENSAIELEKITNDLLGKMTDGQVSIEILTQKANQNGTIKEVFDIIITDEFHTGPYALYSGGEQFRIAFAIRMALSTLLARRSGVKVSAIFYDEAFTDLDPDGINKLVEAFKILSANFRYQLVITHQSELKNQFDDVITVKKTPEGSFLER